MSFFNKLILAFIVSFAMLATAPTAMAKAKGKIENATAAETEVAIDETVEIAEDTLEAIRSGEEKDSVMKRFKKTKQRAKTIESTVTYRLREKALGTLGKARSAFKKGKLEDAEALMVKSLELFKDIKAKYHNF